ncbi:putative gustatory receptor 98b isoform X3 [Drosophila takahashii]|uniref:putative gustatory receptor 98b isoform X3 n=1 Tax=Drosophila takahashii TaxID=29030 RepID=UPI001CF8CC0F|nr:putative gustatory receptor 98b [Drosophila takahashii]
MVAKSSRLLATALPYLQIFSVLALAPPPQSFGNTSHKRLRCYLMGGYVCYAASIIVLVLVVSYLNIVAINEEVLDYNVGDFTRVMGNIQKSLYSLMAIANHLNMLFNYRRLAGIYEDIASLEKEIDQASQCFGGQKQLLSFRFRLAFTVGLWMTLLVGLMPRFTLLAMGPYVSWPSKILTEFVTIMQQLKCLEYCVFVLMVHELLLRLRHTLLQLQAELEDCNRQDMLQAVCVALKRNQLLLGRIWRLEGELCSYFSLPMILLFIFNGLTILHVINWAYINTFLDNDCCRYDRFCTCSILLINLLMACLLSQRCINSYNCFLRILHQIRCMSAASDFPMLIRGLQEYSLQMQHLKLLFTCGGFFDINLKYFGGMLVTILGYTIILIQFKVQAFAEDEHKSSLHKSV